MNSSKMLRFSSLNYIFLISISLTVISAVLVRQSIVVDQRGGANFTTIQGAIQGAIDVAPRNTNVRDGYTVIHVRQGIYQAYISIGFDKRNIMLTGAGNEVTVITGDRSVAQGLQAFDTATFDVSGDHFVAINITFRNTAGPAKNQSVAVLNYSNQSAFYNCSFEGYQDTLLTHYGMQFYRDCDIYGTIDFIWGDATAIFQNCNIFVRRPLLGQFNVIVAQGREKSNETTGICLHNCRINVAPDSISRGGSTITYLGRPWKTYSRVIYMQSFINSLIDSLGWVKWNTTTDTSLLYFAEYDNIGPGSITNKRVNWSGYHKKLSFVEANKFTVSNFIFGDEWLPLTGVPFRGGLM